MKNIKFAVFDLDGTLLNTIDTIAYYVNQTLQKYGIGEMSVDEVKAFVGDGSRSLIERTMLHLGADLQGFEEIHAYYKSSYDKEPFYLTDVYCGIPELIGELIASGVTVAVLSNKPHSAVTQLISRYFGDKITHVFGSVTGIPNKPDPAALERVLTALGASPSEILYVGDTAVDMETGKGGGCALTVGVLWGFRERAELEKSGADAIVSHPHEISELLV